jgi:hypothetical protein
VCSSSVAEKGFAGDRSRQQWQQQYQGALLTPPHQRSTQRWANAVRRWLASLRHIVGIVNNTLLNTFHLARERPHGVQVFMLVWAQKWPCTTFVSGSTCNVMRLLSLLLNSLHGEQPIGIHAKRLRYSRSSMLWKAWIPFLRGCPSWWITCANNISCRSISAGGQPQTGRHSGALPRQVCVLLSNI